MFLEHFQKHNWIQTDDNSFIKKLNDFYETKIRLDINTRIKLTVFCIYPTETIVDRCETRGHKYFTKNIDKIIEDIEFKHNYYDKKAVNQNIFKIATENGWELTTDIYKAERAYLNKKETICCYDNCDKHICILNKKDKYVINYNNTTEYYFDTIESLNKFLCDTVFPDKFSRS